jgi:hypothetical protein
MPSPGGSPSPEVLLHDVLSYVCQERIRLASADGVPGWEFLQKFDLIHLHDDTDHDLPRDALLTGCLFAVARFFGSDRIGSSPYLSWGCYPSAKEFAHILFVTD